MVTCRISGTIGRFGLPAMVFGSVLASTEAMALSCAGRSATQALHSPYPNELVFIGRVTSAEKPRSNHSQFEATWTFEVLKVVSGEVPATVTVRHLDHWSGLRLAQSKIYVVTAYEEMQGYLVPKCGLPQQDIDQSALLAAASR